jgi:hypothetical protein
MVFPQENFTLLTGPNRAPMGSKAGPLCAAAARCARRRPAVIPDFVCAVSTAEWYWYQYLYQYRQRS